MIALGPLDRSMAVALQTATPTPTASPTGTPTPTPGVGVGELVDVWQLVIRAAWFLAGFLVVVGFGWFVLVPVVSRAVRHRNPNNPTIQEAVSRYVRLLAVVIATLVGALAAGYGTILGDSALVVAAATLAIGVAAQTVIGSLVSGLVLVVDPEFNVGDYIEWQDGEGTVQSITLRVTRVRTPDGELITVPNTVLTGQEITRPFGRGRYRVVEQIALDYDANLDDAMTLLDAATRDVEAIAEAPSPDVDVDEFAPDAIVVAVTYWIADPEPQDVPDVRSAYARAAKRRLDAAGITISPASKRELLGRVRIERDDERFD